eukprot:COSAG01_NODE_2769_length_7102_cov_6.325146_2_plen_226_part_00
MDLVVRGTHGACPTIRYIDDDQGGMYYVISGGENHPPPHPYAAVLRIAAAITMHPTHRASDIIYMQVSRSTLIGHAISRTGNPPSKGVLCCKHRSMIRGYARSTLGTSHAPRSRPCLRVPRQRSLPRAPGTGESPTAQLTPLTPSCLQHCTRVLCFRYGSKRGSTLRAFCSIVCWVRSDASDVDLWEMGDGTILFSFLSGNQGNHIFAALGRFSGSLKQWFEGQY